MAFKIDVSEVSVKTFPEDGDITPKNAGIWHNYYLYSGRLRQQEIEWTEDYKIWCDLIVVQAENNEREGILPKGSVEYVKQISDILRSGGDLEEGNFKPVITKLKELNDKLLKNPEFENTTLVGVSSIAYYSSLFWSEINFVDENNAEAKAFWNKIKIPKWLKTVAADIAGALGGGASGLAVGTFVGGPVGSWIGLGVGVVAGGISGSTID